MNQQILRKISPKELHAWLAKGFPQVLLIDVREAQELVIAPFPFPAIHFPLSKASIGVRELDEVLLERKPKVVICHSGLRSWNFGTWLIEQGCAEEVWNLEGGIDAWSVDVDSTVPRY